MISNKYDYRPNDYMFKRQSSPGEWEVRSPRIFFPWREWAVTLVVFFFLGYIALCQFL